jgi:hypothetical protein
MERRVSISELKRHPMRIVREALQSAQGATITYRGIPVAVLRACSASVERMPETRMGSPSDDVGAALGAQEDALHLHGGWLGPTAEPREADTEGVLDSASWGQWDALSPAERDALLRAIQKE